jgi:TRAP-type mannitol/chloroaromatic compound transport system permease small subunit
MEVFQILGNILFICCFLIIMIYLLSRLQMKAWLAELESFFEDKLNSLKKEEQNEEEK